MTMLNGAPVSTELLKIKMGTLKTSEDVKHSVSDHPKGISAPSFRTAPLWVEGGCYLNHSNIDVLLIM